MIIVKVITIITMMSDREFIILIVFLMKGQKERKRNNDYFVVLKLKIEQ